MNSNSQWFWFDGLEYNRIRTEDIWILPDLQSAHHPLSINTNVRSRKVSSIRSIRILKDLDWNSMKSIQQDSTCRIRVRNKFRKSNLEDSKIVENSDLRSIFISHCSGMQATDSQALAPWSRSVCYPYLKSVSDTPNPSVLTESLCSCHFRVYRLRHNFVALSSAFEFILHAAGLALAPLYFWINEVENLASKNGMHQVMVSFCRCGSLSWYEGHKICNGRADCIGQEDEISCPKR